MSKYEDIALEEHRRVHAKIYKYIQAREEAEKAFETLKYGPNRCGYETTPKWKAVCKVLGISEHSDFGDWTC